MKIRPKFNEIIARPRDLLSDKDGPAYSGASLRDISAQGPIGQFDRFHEEPAFEPAQSHFGLSFPLGLLRRQMLLILAITILGTVGVGVWVSTLKKSYTATALLVLDQRSSNLLEPVTQNKIEADGEVEILKSDSVAQRVVERLNLADELSASQAKAGLFSRIFGMPGSSTEAANDAAPAADQPTSPDDSAVTPSSPAVATAVRLLMQSVTVRRRGLTDVIALEATAKSPQRAAQIANTYAEAYLEEQVAAKLAGIERASLAISRRLAELDEELKRSESQIGTRQIYQDNVQRFKAIAQRRETVAPDSRIASRARAPDIPSFPRPALFMLLGGMMSLGAGLAAGYLRDVYSRRVHTEDELELLSGVPNLASVPDVTKARRGDVTKLSDEILTRPRSAYSGAIRRLYFNLQLLASRGSKLGLVLVTSSEEHEGRTTVALSLARAAAVAGLNVVIVDCDLRRPTLHKMLELKNEVGLVDLLAQTAEERSVVQSDRKSTCKVIASGKTGPIPTEWLLNPDRIKDTLRKLEANYDLVILSAPPLGLSVEPLVIMRDVDVVLFVARAGVSTPTTIRSNIRQLRRSSEAHIYTVMTYTYMRGSSAILPS